MRLVILTDIIKIFILFKVLGISSFYFFMLKLHTLGGGWGLASFDPFCLSVQVCSSPFYFSLYFSYFIVLFRFMQSL